MDRWIRRAVSEEFGITGSENFDEVFDSDSARILGLTFEADIGNYSLPVIINTKQKAEDFEREISETIQREEIGEYKMIDVDEIPAILVRYNDNKSKYHPSTYVRLLLAYLHYNGYKRGFEKIIKANGEINS